MLSCAGSGRSWSEIQRERAFMPNLFRALPRLLAVFLWTLSWYALLLLSLGLRPWADAWQLRVRNAIFRVWSRGICRIVRMKVEVEGRPPTGPFLLVANHVSYIDIILLGSRIDAAFVAKADLRGWPLAGRIIAAADTIFIDRAKKKDVLRVMGIIGRELGRGLGVVIFPEGTSSKGDTVLRFKPSLLEYATRHDHPVCYAAVTYVVPGDAPPAHEAICWWGDAPFGPHFLRLLGLPGFQAKLVFGARPLHGTDRKDLSERLRTSVEELFVPVP